MKRWFCLLLAIVALPSCREKNEGPIRSWVVTPVVGLKLAVPPGWSLDDNTVLDNPDQGGVALRLISTRAVSGAPRIDVILDKKIKRGTELDALLRRSLDAMADFQQQGVISIHQVDRREVNVGPRRAYRVTHDYTMITPGEPVVISQLATLMVLDGRGVAITANGRQELFQPHLEPINHTFNTLQVVMPPGGLTPQRMTGHADGEIDSKPPRQQAAATDTNG